MQLEEWEGEEWKVSKNRTQRKVFGAKKPRAQGAAFTRPRQTDVSILTLFPMILSPDDLPP